MSISSANTFFVALLGLGHGRVKPGGPLRFTPACILPPFRGLGARAKGKSHTADAMNCVPPAKSRAWCGRDKRDPPANGVWSGAGKGGRERVNEHGRKRSRTLQGQSCKSCLKKNRVHAQNGFIPFAPFAFFAARKSQTAVATSATLPRMAFGGGVGGRGWQMANGKEHGADGAAPSRPRPGLIL